MNPFRLPDFHPSRSWISKTRAALEYWIKLVGVYCAYPCSSMVVKQTCLWYRESEEFAAEVVWVSVQDSNQCVIDVVILNHHLAKGGVTTLNFKLGDHRYMTIERRGPRI